MAAGEFAQVNGHLEQALETAAEWVGDHDVYAMLAEAAVQQRDRQALLRYAPLAEQSAERYGHTLYRAIAQRALGVASMLAGDENQSEEQLQAALDAFQELGTRWQTGRTLVELGELARLRAHTTLARKYYSSALDHFEALGAVPDSERVRSVILQMESTNAKPPGMGRDQ
jgi:predicted DCC family thiol-disulfide oxidoreductase YuxK